MQFQIPQDDFFVQLLAFCCEMMNSRMSLAVRQGFSITTEWPQLSSRSTLHPGTDSAMTVAPETSTTWTKYETSFITMLNQLFHGHFIIFYIITWSCLPHITCKGVVIRCKCFCKAYLEFSLKISINTKKDKRKEVFFICSAADILCICVLGAISSDLTFFVERVVRLSDIHQSL